MGLPAPTGDRRLLPGCSVLGESLGAVPRFQNRRLGLDNSESCRAVDGMLFVLLSCWLVSSLTLYLLWGPICGVPERSSTHLSAVVFLTECQTPQYPEERGVLHVLVGPLPEGGVCVLCALTKEILSERCMHVLFPYHVGC